MKNSVSIVLLLCFALYHFGYYAFYFSYDQHIERKWQDKIYGDTQEEFQDRLIEIPLSAPYMPNQEEFQATNASFEKDGVFYRAIKQRYQNDTLQIVVVPDMDRGILDRTVKKWISFLTEDDSSQDQSGGVLVKLLVKDYIQTNHFSFISNTDSPSECVIGFVFYPYLNPAEGIASPPPRFS
ncbi:hypothetical protein LZF95_24710 [Algoriphagus sp. AGSA1]|uniref:hypothetical protein n=1 Tax=Algoriphagus sp. AGSA1 TaxID=2907213 RepID=UPI001F334C05|nr:hypothetical protein [Algoriphagus sp. AGSA1]MCE7057909.1 hypothetical protein [Algoriphagus sp. AGSA1]